MRTLLKQQMQDAGLVDYTGCEVPKGLVLRIIDQQFSDRFLKEALDPEHLAMLNYVGYSDLVCEYDPRYQALYVKVNLYKHKVFEYNAERIRHLFQCLNIRTLSRGCTFEVKTIHIKVSEKRDV